MDLPIIDQLGVQRDALDGQVVIVTGGGGGIGYEAARALLWMGASVIIAEINAANGQQATLTLAAEHDPKRIAFIYTDVGDEQSVTNLYNVAMKRFGKVDAVLNNATVAVLGQVKDVPIEQWDASYKVNLRGPVLMARTFLPDMIERKHGTFVCVSSTGTAYLGGYETFKAAQVHLANTLDAELEGTGVIAFTIGPGLVPTETASNAIAQLAPQMGMSVAEFFELNKNAVLGVEEAGVGFALSILYAERFKGIEISSIQALKAADINYGAPPEQAAHSAVEASQRIEAGAQCERVRQTLKEQSDGWKHRSLFERQWVVRDFRKIAGMSADAWLGALDELAAGLKQERELKIPPLARLANYYDHLAELAKGYEKDQAKLQENLIHVYGWRDEVTRLEQLLK